MNKPFSVHIETGHKFLWLINLADKAVESRAVTQEVRGSLAAPSPLRICTLPEGQIMATITLAAI